MELYRLKRVTEALRTNKRCAQYASRYTLDFFQILRERGERSQDTLVDGYTMQQCIRGIGRPKNGIHN